MERDGAERHEHAVLPRLVPQGPLVLPLPLREVTAPDRREREHVARRDVLGRCRDQLHEHTFSAESHRPSRASCRAFWSSA
ncbi:MAG: hypothetical protein E6J55_10005 [Deltaproteobacteria bacterium]|nr:MAG: hypothetical protein E6J55_10005 [Deltaproteobacteria bacterium]